MLNNNNTSNENEETLGFRISKRRKQLNYTQEEFSQLLGVTPQAVSKWENGASCPDIMLLPKISEVLDISIDELMGSRRVQQKNEQLTEVVSHESYGGERKNADISKLKLRIVVHDSKKDKPVNITLPLPFIARIADTGVKISSVLGTNHLKDSQVEKILELIKNGVSGEILDLVADDNTRVRIEIS